MEYDGKLQEVDGNQQRKWQVADQVGWPSKQLLLELGCVPPSIHMKEAYQDMKCWGHTLGWDKALGLPITEAIHYLTGIHIQVDSLSFEPRLETHSIEWHQHLEWWFCITASPRNDLSLRLWCVSCRSQAYCIHRVLNRGSRREHFFCEDQCAVYRGKSNEMPGTWIDQCADIARQLLQRTRGVRQVTAGLTSHRGGTVYSDTRMDKADK